MEIMTREYGSLVIDGDTFAGYRDKNAVRLENVNAPELHEPGGLEAKEYLESLILDKPVTIKTVGTGLHRRRIAKVFTETSAGVLDVNEAMRVYVRGLPR